MAWIWTNLKFIWGSIWVAQFEISFTEFSASRFQEELRMYVEYVSMKDLQKWYCMSHRQGITVVHAIHFASIVSNVMPKYLSRSEN